ncbi:oligosaccharide flippase family protein [Erythrobacter vulgaris]|uniref:Oligosaccharide flippase family protein n=2 Tax=Qipengyuania vulgaris TaxID=291985 RepID=A0A844XSN7_9SPHN|nr:oligosaccharide flippase family protein [Qipengyuania vulgaris]
METDPMFRPRRDGLANILKNVAWLMGGKGFGAVCSIAYLAVLSRSLGLKDFGHFSLIFATAISLVALASFQTWQTVVKFGAQSVQEKDWTRFGRLIWLCGGLDVAGAVIGCIIAASVFYGFGETLELNARYIDVAFWFACAMLWSRMTTPNGIVRVLDRFDLGIYVEAVVPAGRLIASFIILAVGPTVERFLFAWAFFDLIVGLLYWIVAWRIVPEALHHKHLGHFRETLSTNPSLPQFFGVTYFSSTLDAVYKQGPLLAVGYFLGTSAAGLYRLADQLAQGIGKLSSLLARAIFPEFAMARTTHSIDNFSKLVRQTSIIAAIGGAAVTLAAVFLGEPLLLLIGGEDYVRGAAILIPLAIGASFELASVTYEPLLYSTGHALYPLLVRALAVAVLAAGIFLLVHLGPIGVGIAVAIGLAVLWAVMSLTVKLVLRNLKRTESPQ